MAVTRIDKGALLLLARAAKGPLSADDVDCETLDGLAGSGLVLNYQGHVIITTRGLLEVNRRPLRVLQARSRARFRRLTRAVSGRFDRWSPRSGADMGRAAPHEATVGAAH